MRRNIAHAKSVASVFLRLFPPLGMRFPARFFYFPPKRRSHSLSNSSSEKYETSNLPFFGVPRMRTLVPPLRDSRSSRSFRCGSCRCCLRGAGCLAAPAVVPPAPAPLPPPPRDPLVGEEELGGEPMVCLRELDGV